MAYTVKEVPLVWIPVFDGTRLAATLWLPSKEGKITDIEETFPAILGTYDVSSLPHKDLASCRHVGFYILINCSACLQQNATV